ncbi:ArdC family protein [Citrobacter koseri]|uniref:ArdC family protein n=1 Tax=Citrobacter koseri TaxID=545 RepID=UPI001FCBCBBE|nr:zincin-like metallopeptidase domain-containing protein [Citrobacter koseri]MDM9067010.1 zincin-like metallopeptidase domain-containing protein [Citrobacter koseri]MDM9081532.1 zincin-like metallopeptidase domain-containing protein [Citrobacter koseri]MDM9090081.1 zincin-like metallopeptidase domain-containing protein [Citrobacter koseri]MDM9095486.1 zincin-like metallopeptidase domain-containing protein [Citrobacter koseri]MDM9269897.1 zincin-like metallopeptidase domain-containing protein 
MNKSTRGRKAASSQKADLYQQVTEKIMAAMEKGVPPWRRPWRSAKNVHGSALPVNATTGRHYSGVNIPLLWMSAEERGFNSDRWLTYQQAKAVGGQVRKGESSSMAIIYKPFEKQATDDNDNKLFDKDGSPVMESLAMLKPLQLFNVAQCDGLPDAVTGVQQATTTEDGCGSILSEHQQEQALAILNATGVTCTSYRQNRAYYQSSADRIVMPAMPQFVSEADYWSTLLHELVHATGHSSRLNREGITSSSRKFGDPVYAFEELIAETGSAFLCAELGVYGDVQHESYLASWLKVLRDDKKAFFRACRFAREASEFLLLPLNRQPEQAA